MRQAAVPFRAFAEAFSARDEQRRERLPLACSRAYLDLILKRREPMSKVITLLTVVSVVFVAAAPALYAYASLV